MRRKDREVSDINEIENIIEKCKVCHLAMVDKGLPYVVPLNFGYDIEGNTLTLYFHSAKAGRKIDILRENNSVCFEICREDVLGYVEVPCNSGFSFESVMGFGNVEFVEDVNEKCKSLTLLMQHQSNQDFVFEEKHANAVCVFKVVTTDFVGKRKTNTNGHS
ncbi:MAG: pyridoxamine 5'-phosphate oxidase family protein [Bacillota bacterium]|nr:pyridoxamine 5'-phosphate oxidase family protein [Bacillota bacterium]